MTKTGFPLLDRVAVGLSGLCVLPLGLGVMAAAPVAGRLAGRTGPRASWHRPA